MIKELSFEIDILNNEYWVNVYIGGVDNLRKKLIKHFKEDVFADDVIAFRGRTYYKKGFAPFIWVNLDNINKRKDSFYATFAHEAIHAVSDILDEIGADNAEEILAYSVGATIRRYDNIKGIKQ